MAILLTTACVEPALDPPPGEATTISLAEPRASSSTSPRAALAAGEHEPRLSIFTKVFHYYDAKSIDFTGIDREVSLDLNWWTNGTPYPSLFRLTGTYPNGQVFSTEQGTNPVLTLPYIPGQTTAHIDIDHQSQSPEFRGKFIIRQPVLPEQLGGCGDDIRDRFIGWARSQRNWLTNYQITYVEETLPNKLTLFVCGGLCYETDFTLRGSFAALPGSRGPILQVDEVELNPYSGSTTFSSLLFFDENGQLLKQVGGRLYFVLPDGNLLVSSAYANTGAWNFTESVMAISPTGEKIWARGIGGTPPGTVVTTAAGNLAMPWSSYASTNRAAGLPIFSPSTGADAEDTFVDRSPLCTNASTDEDCVGYKPSALYDFDQWWVRNWYSYGQYTDGAYRTCNSYGCTTATLAGWLVFNEELVIEIHLERRGNDGKVETLKRLAFYGREDFAPHASLGGAFYRRLAADRLLVSTTYGAWATSTVREGSGEGLASVGANAVVVWRRPLVGPPALLRARANSYGSAGHLLTGNRLFWATYSSYESGSSTTSWIDLATGAVLPVPAKRILEGLCRPH